MRARLAKAAFEVISERGHSAFRTAAVAAHAGVSQGAQVHHFATKDRLTLAALEHGFACAQERTNKVIASMKETDDPIALLIGDFRSFFMGDEFWVGLDITIHSKKNPELAQIRQVAADYRHPSYQAWVRVFVEAGWAEVDAVEIVRMTSSLISGISMRSLWDNVDAYFESVIVRWTDIVRATWPKTDGLTSIPAVESTRARRKPTR